MRSRDSLDRVDVFDLEPNPGSRRSFIGVPNLPARHDLRQICEDESFHNTTRNSQDANDSNLLETNQSSLGLTPASQARRENEPLHEGSVALKLLRCLRGSGCCGGAGACAAAFCSV